MFSLLVYSPDLLVIIGIRVINDSELVNGGISFRFMESCRVMTLTVTLVSEREKKK